MPHDGFQAEVIRLCSWLYLGTYAVQGEAKPSTDLQMQGSGTWTTKSVFRSRLLDRQFRHLDRKLCIIDRALGIVFRILLGWNEIIIPRIFRRFWVLSK